MRRKRQDDGEDYVCPMNVEMPKRSVFDRGQVHAYEEGRHQVRANFCVSFYYLNQRACLSCWKMEDSEVTVRQIGAFSEGINNLTVGILTVGSPRSRTLR